MSKNFNTIQPQPDDGANTETKRTLRRRLLDANRVIWKDIGEKSLLTKAGMAVGALAVAATVGEQAADLYDVERKPGFTRFGGTQEVRTTDRGVAFEGWLYDTVDSAGDAIYDTAGNVVHTIRDVGNGVIGFVIDDGDKNIDASEAAPIGEFFEVVTPEAGVDANSFLSGGEVISPYTPENVAAPEPQSTEQGE